MAEPKAAKHAPSKSEGKPRRKKRAATEPRSRGIAPDARLGAGLISMRERAVELGGTFTVEPAPTDGTSVRAHLPLPAPEE